MFDELLNRISERRCGNIRTVRRQEQLVVGNTPKWAVARQRLCPEHIQRCASNDTVVQRADQVVLNDAHTTTDVNKDGTALHLMENVRGEHIVGVGNIREDSNDEVTVRNNVLEPIRTTELRDPKIVLIAATVDAHLASSQTNNVHAKGNHNICNRTANVAVTNDSHRRAAQWWVREPVPNFFFAISLKKGHFARKVETRKCNMLGEQRGEDTPCVGHRSFEDMCDLVQLVGVDAGADRVHPQQALRGRFADMLEDFRRSSGPNECDEAVTLIRLQRFVFFNVRDVRHPTENGWCEVIDHLLR
eukprot:PhM_4_TR10403/c0_g1_i1/m.21586